jgi:hypothetical protein
MSNRPLTKTEWLKSLEELWEAAQQPRKWQGLTDEDIWQMVNDCTIAGDLHADKFARAIEAKLKERNT